MAFVLSKGSRRVQLCQRGSVASVSVPTWVGATLKRVQDRGEECCYSMMVL